MHQLRLQYIMSKLRIQKVYKKSIPKDWSEVEIDRLEHMVLDLRIYDWEKLARDLGKKKDNVKKVWKNIVYYRIKGKERIADTEKWSRQEDEILINIAKNKINSFVEVSEFLKYRSTHSIQAR